MKNLYCFLGERKWNEICFEFLILKSKLLYAVVDILMAMFECFQMIMNMLVILVSFNRSSWSPLLSIFFTEEGCKCMWCIRPELLSIDLWRLKFIIWKLFKNHIIRGIYPSKCRGRSHTNDLSNCCKRFPTHSVGKIILWQIYLLSIKPLANCNYNF